MTSLQLIIRGVLSLKVFDVESAEKAEKSIDEFINKRARDKAEANKEEEKWRAAVRRVREKRRRENRRLWIDHHGHMNLLHLGLAAEHARPRSRPGDAITNPASFRALRGARMARTGGGGC
jgi:hypothetical protein